MKSDLFLPQRHSWLKRLVGVPARPKGGDRGPVMDALFEILDAAGGLEYSREALRRAIVIAQGEFETLCKPQDVTTWAGANTPAIYYEFCNAIVWTRTVEDRYIEQLIPAIKHEPDLWKNLQKIRSRSAKSQFKDARLLAKCSLHKFTPPYASFSAKVEGSTLIYPVVDRIVDAENFRANLHFASGRHAAALIDEYWNAVVRFMDGLLEVFYPSIGPGN